jgi:hypothetical protein
MSFKMTSACPLWTGLDLYQAACVVEDLVPDPLQERVAPLLPLRHHGGTGSRGR